MTTGARTITVELPASFPADEQTREILRTALQALTGLGGADPGPCANLSHLCERGWDVSCGLTWIVQARRDGVLEEAVGQTREEACERLRQFCRLHEVDGTP